MRQPVGLTLEIVSLGRQAIGQLAELGVGDHVTARAVFGDLLGAIGGVAQADRFRAHVLRAVSHLYGALRHLRAGLDHVPRRLVTGAFAGHPGPFSLDPGLVGADPRLTGGPAGDVHPRTVLIGKSSSLGGLGSGFPGLGASRGCGLSLGGRGDPELAVAEA